MPIKAWFLSHNIVEFCHVRGLKIPFNFTHMVVVFPAPLCPRNESICPSYRFRDRFVTASLPLEKTFVKFFICIASKEFSGSSWKSSRFREAPLKIEKIINKNISCINNLCRFAMDGFLWTTNGDSVTMTILCLNCGLLINIYIYRNNKTMCFSGGSEGARGTPLGPNSFNFMQFLGKFGKIVCWRPPESWCPHLGEILDPPLCFLHDCPEKTILLHLRVMHTFILLVNLVNHVFN